MYSESLSNKTLYIGFDPATLACAFVCNYISRRHSRDNMGKKMWQTLYCLLTLRSARTKRTLSQSMKTSRLSLLPSIQHSLRSETLRQKIIKISLVNTSRSKATNSKCQSIKGTYVLKALLTFSCNPFLLSKMSWLISEKKFI